MPVAFAPYLRGPRRAPHRRGDGPLVIGLVNNMPDAALVATETQFQGLLAEAAGDVAIELRPTSFPELARAGEARARIDAEYWPYDALLAAAPDALIVTGTEPRAARLVDEPYWQRSVELLAFAEVQTSASIWSCLAAHAAVLAASGIERQRLPEKRCGVYRHRLRNGHPLLAGVAEPMPMPHSRWNELPVPALEAAGYTLLSSSTEGGADAFVRDAGSLLLFFQGHPEYDATTLLREYRRDVGRFLAGEQDHYPTLPYGYFDAAAVASLEAFRDAALAQRQPALLERFPFAALAAGLRNTWRPAAVAIYRNWLGSLRARRLGARGTGTVSSLPV